MNLLASFLGFVSKIFFHLTSLKIKIIFIKYTQKTKKINTIFNYLMYHVELQTLNIFPIQPSLEVNEYKSFVKLSSDHWYYLEILSFLTVFPNKLVGLGAILYQNLK